MNEGVKVLKTEILSNNWYVLKKVTFNFLTRKGNWIEQRNIH